MRIFRQQLNLTTVSIVVPYGSKVISVAPARDVIDGYIDVWYIVTDPNNLTVSYPVAILGTGHEFDRGITEFGGFVGTCVMPSGLVWHVFVGQPE